MNKIRLTFEWSETQADMGEFRQRSQLFKPLGLNVVVELDATPENFFNPAIHEYYEKSLLFELGQGDKPVFVEPEVLMLTPVGAATARDLLQEAFYSEVKPMYADPKADWDENEVVSDDDW